MNSLLASSFFEFYASSMRASLFSGFLTMSGFLFSAHTFIIIHLKKEVYEHENYLEVIDGLRSSVPNRSHYGSLRRLSRLLVASTSCCLLTSMLQMSVGLNSSNIAAGICVASAAVSMVLLSISLVVMSLGFRFWFNELEKRSANLISEHKKKKEKLPK